MKDRENIGSKSVFWGIWWRIGQKGNQWECTMIIPPLPSLPHTRKYLTYRQHNWHFLPVDSNTHTELQRAWKQNSERINHTMCLPQKNSIQPQEPSKTAFLQMCSDGARCWWAEQTRLEGRDETYFLAFITQVKEISTAINLLTNKYDSLIAATGLELHLKASKLRMSA